MNHLPSFNELAREKRMADCMAIIDMMSAQEQADIAYRLISDVLPCVNDQMGEAMTPVCKAYEAEWEAIEQAVEFDRIGRMDPADRRVAMREFYS